MVGTKEVLSENWGLTANSEDELSQLRLFYTYKQDETARATAVADVNFTNPIDLDEIVDGSVDASSAEFTSTSEIVFEFDAKENFQNQDLANALYKLVGDSSSTMTYQEIELNRNGVRSFQIAEETQDHQLKIFNIDTDCGNSTAELIENLNYPYNYDIQEQSTTSLGEYQLNVQNYALEEFAPEKTDDLIEDYNEAITTALDANFLENIGKNVFTRYYDSNKLQSVTWDIGNGEQISEIKFISYYNESDTNTVYGIGLIKLATPINVNELNKTNINNIFSDASNKATYSTVYTFGYDNTKQNDRNDLVNAIFEAYGMTKEAPEGAIRLYIDQGSHTDSTLQSTAKVFKVVEIATDYVKEFTINIKEASTDSELINKLQNPSNYIVYDEKSYEMNGQKVSSGRIE